ncbi:MAG: hypothetical protein ACYC91_19050 [Solirubrobacteraceae bacterium]
MSPLAWVDGRARGDQRHFEAAQEQLELTNLGGDPIIELLESVDDGQP